ncbi:hypothetical protein, partial [Actinomadura fibrosa]
AAASGAAGSLAYGQGAVAADVAAGTGGSTAKGVLAKIGGTKGAAAGAGAVASAVIAGWFLWPAGPGVGGESHGALHGHFTRPGILVGQPNMPASETPTMDLDLAVAPARAKRGTLVRAVIGFHARTPWGGSYLPGGQRRCYGEKANRPDVEQEYGFGFGAGYPPGLGKKESVLALYRVPPAAKKEVPQGDNAVVVKTTKEVTGESEPYVQAQCAYLSKRTETRTFTVPGGNVLPPGDYLVAPIMNPRFGRTAGVGPSVTSEQAGAVTKGALPGIRVLGG